MERQFKTPHSIIELFETLSPLEWYGFGPVFDQTLEDPRQNHLVPRVIWRFKVDEFNLVKVRAIERAIVNGVTTFHGNVEWVILPPNPNGPGRNWVITTKRVSELMETGEYRDHSAARAALAASDPAHGRLANDDVSELVDHLAETIKRSLAE